MKKIALTLAVLAFALVIPFSTANAASYEFIGSRYTNNWSDYYGEWEAHRISSTGGWLEIVPDYSATYDVYEYDPGSNKDEHIGTYYIPKGYPQKIYVEPYVDGDNNLAEIYVISHAYDVLLNFYD